MQYLEEILGDGIGLIETKKEIFNEHIKISIAFIESMTNKGIISKHILNPLLNYNNNSLVSEKILKNPDDSLIFIQSRIITATNSKFVTNLNQVIENILSGYTVVFMDKAETALIVGSRKIDKKAVSSPENESTILASQDSFTDDLTII